MSMVNRNFPGTREIKSLDDLKPGTVLRLMREDGSSDPFTDVVVLGHVVRKAPVKDCVDIKAARPYLYTSGAETNCATPLMWAETFSMYETSLLGGYNQFATSAYYILCYQGKNGTTDYRYKVGS